MSSLNVHRSHLGRHRRPIHRISTLLTLCVTASLAHAAELRMAGVLGNSGEDGATQVTFGGKSASGMGPVLDDSNTLWERGGTKQLNRYALDGRLLASFELPDGADRGDQMIRAGGVLLMKLRKALFTLPLDATPGTKPKRIPGDVDVIASTARDGKVVVLDKETFALLDVAAGTRAELFKPGVRVSAIHEDVDGAIIGFGEGKVFAWKNSTLMPGFPKGFNGERPQKIGRYWFSHSWHGTINRMNESFEPEPGVVLGGASGSFIGYMPLSNDLSNGRGMVRLRDELYAVSGNEGVVQFVQWNGVESRFEITRRIGSFTGVKSVALDSAGNVWTPRGSWRWQDSPETPHTQGDLEPSVVAQAAVLGGKTLCVYKKHYSYPQLARGPLIDENGLSHFDTQPIKEFNAPDNVTGAAAITEGNQNRLIVTSPDGKAFEIRVGTDGQLISKPESLTIPGLKRCTSLAWFGGKLLAADNGAVVAFERNGAQGWKESARVAEYGGEVYIHSDGKRLAVSDPTKESIHLFDALDAKPVSFTGLKAPANLAVAGDRIAVIESGKQRLVKLELHANPASTSSIPAKPIANGKSKPAAHSGSDFQDWGRAGGIPFEIALTSGNGGLTVSIRSQVTPQPKIELGVANDKAAYALSSEGMKPVKGQFDFVLPAGDWSKTRLAATVKLPDQQERFGFLDHHAIHAPFNADPAAWAPFDFETYRELVAARKSQIRIDFEQPKEGKASVVVENEKGERVRNLASGRSFTAGKHTLIWDGLDETGKLVTPGNYTWRGVTHEGIRPQYVMNFGNGDEATTEPWGPNHSTLHAAAANSKLVFFAAPVTEGGWALVALDDKGKLVQGYEHQQGYGIQHDAIAADEQHLYVAQDGFAWGGRPDFGKGDWKATWTATVCRFDIATGKLVEWPGKVRGLPVDTMEVNAQSDLKQFNLGGIAVLDGKLYVSSRDEKAVLVVDAKSGQQLEKIAFEDARHLATDPTKKIIYAVNARGVARLSDRKLIIENADISGIAVAPNGDLLLSSAKTHQVARYSPEGKQLATIGKPGGPYRGKYDPDRMVNPAGLVTGPDGKLWVTEKRWNPKRVIAWDLTKNAVTVEKFGMPHYGGDGSGFDPENPRRWIGLGCFWDVDLEKKSARPTHVLSLDEGHLGHYEPQSYAFFREAGRTFVATRGKIALISEVLPDGTLKDIAATAGTHHFAYAFDWKPPQAYIDAFYEKWPEKKGNEKPGKKGEGKPWSQRGMGVLWVDRNGDGEAQKEEFDFCGDQIDYAGGPWGHMQNSLTFYMPVSDKTQVKVAAIKPKGFLKNGVPDYPTLNEAIAQATPVSLTPGNKRSGVATVRDRFGRFLFNSDPEMNAYAGDGRHLWSYPNKWSDVHGSHDAPLPEPGVMQGSMAFLGIAPFDDNSDVFFVNGNHGRCFMLTSDGMYLDEAFVDVRVSYLKNEYRLGGEIFGGSFGRDLKTGKYYVQIGHGPYRIYELAGFEKAKRISGKLTVTQPQIAAAERQNLRQVAAKQQARETTIPGKIAWDKSGQFKTQCDITADSTHLHLTWRVQDSSPWVNNGRDWTKLFATGDTVDFQFAADPKADAKRREPAPGDKRLLIAPRDGKPIAVLYEHRKPGGKNPVEFTSPWRGAKVDDVRQIEGAKINVKTEGTGYTVQASLPLADLGLTLAPGGKLRADFGVTFGDAAGTDTNLRSYWSNQSTGLVDDIPGEIMLSPSLWGQVTVNP